LPIYLDTGYLVINVLFVKMAKASLIGGFGAGRIAAGEYGERIFMGIY
jgi:hypothetical protein